jgi:hypothetical protein
MRTAGFPKYSGQFVIAAQDGEFAVGRVLAGFAPGRPGYPAGMKGLHLKTVDTQMKALTYLQ